MEIFNEKSHIMVRWKDGKDYAALVLSFNGKSDRYKVHYIGSKKNTSVSYWALRAACRRPTEAEEALFPRPKPRKEKAPDSVVKREMHRVAPALAVSHHSGRHCPTTPGIFVPQQWVYATCDGKMRTGKV